MTTAIDTPQTDAAATSPAADPAEPGRAAESPAADPPSTPPGDAATDIVIQPTIDAPMAPEPSDGLASAPSAEGSADSPDSPDSPDPTTGDATAESASERAPKAPAAAPADCGPLLKKTFPALFAGGPKPLKLRIQVDIQERAPGVFSKPALSAFFRRYTGTTGYLIAVSRAKTRFDLDGAPAGELSDEHRKIAVDELARRRGNHEARAALEEQQRRNRATLLHDFERTTLAPANFCALKGIGVDELEGYLATARREAAERPRNPRAFDDRHDERGPQPRQPAARPDHRPAGVAHKPPPRRR